MKKPPQIKIREAFVFLSLVISGFCFAQETGAKYLIITHDDYYSAVKPLADWKTQKGIKAKIVRLSDIGSEAAQIKTFVANAYNTWQIRPEYLLLVGSGYQLLFPPFNYQGYTGKSDNYYTNITGDFHNEIIPGRFFMSDTLAAKTVVAKVLGYEKYPYLQEQSWFKKGVTIVNEYEPGQPPSDSIYWDDARYAHGLMNNAGFLHIDSLAYSLGHDTSDVINVINDGRSYILYRGLGYGGWEWPFQEINIEQMNNGYMLPIVISATCGTAEGIGAEWLNAGTPEQPKGTVGFFGTTTALFEADSFRSALARGTLESIFCDSLSTLGKAAEAGRLKYYYQFNDSLEYNSWTCVGDPEMTVWTTTPRPLQVAHFPEAWLGATLMVHVASNTSPVESALVCVMAKHDSSVYHHELTDTYGDVIFIDTLHFPDTALITVTGRNYAPYIEAVVAGHTNGPHLTYKNHHVLDTINGNGNYQPNNGEDIELAVWILNIGDSLAHNVSAILQKAETDNFYQLNDTVKNFGDIASLDSAFTSDDGYNVIIDPNCPDSHEINLKLTLQDIDSTWVSYFSFLVYTARPYMIYKSHSILDTISGNGNHQVNPGENIELAVWIQNIGDSIAENVYGSLQKQEADQYFILSDTIKYFGDILPMDSSWTSEDGYNVLVDSSCPDQHEIKLQLEISDSLDSLWVYQLNLINYAPQLIFCDYLIDDSLKYVLPGDSAGITVSIRNDGSAATENVIGTLISDDTLLLLIQDSAPFGSILPESLSSNQSNPFVITASPLTPPGYTAALKLALNAGVYQDTLDFDIYIGRRNYLIWDPDPNHSSGFIIHAKLSGLNFLGDYCQAFPQGYLNVYEALLVSAGMYSENQIIYDTSTIIPEIEHFLDADGKMYLEGGDVWYYDPSHGGYDFCTRFCISALSNNIGYFTGVSGVDNTFTHGMSFDYSGESSSIDRIDPVGNGIQILKNTFNDNSIGVAANHKTVGVSIEFSGLVDGSPPSTKTALIDSIMQYFGICPTGIKENVRASNEKIITFDIFPNPCRRITNIKLQIPNSKYLITLKIFDVSGRLIKNIELPTAYCPGLASRSGAGVLPTVVPWDGTDENGRKVPEGIYFVRLDSKEYKKTKKIVFLK